MALTRLKSPAAAARWLRSWVTGTLRTDSRQVQPGDAFIAWPGHANDGRQYVRAALAAGAATCLVEDVGVDAFGFDDARVATLPRMKAATGAIADAYYDHPSKGLSVVAATGTNGKTSTAWWTAQALSALGQRCAVVGTLGIGEPSQVVPTGLTTPDPVTLQAALRRFANEGFGACAIEASSIGIVEHRLAALRIAVALFTNFTRDHLDFHSTMDTYWAAKRQLFSWPGLRAAVINIDDGKGAALAAELQAAGGLDLWTYSVQGAVQGAAGTAARLQARHLRYIDDGLAFDLHEGTQGVAVRSTLIGDYNASNLLAVIGALRALGLPLVDAAARVPALTPVPGRMQRVPGAGPEVVVDYAHTPDALDKALTALRPLAAARGGRLWCVFGCGGDRDATKRPLMGTIAEQRADRVVVTSDNPRSESPQQILGQIVGGLSRRGDALVLEDRRTAIARAVSGADPADVVLIAGKGHEDYQEVAGVRHPFSDVDEAAAALHARALAARHAARPGAPS